MRISINHNTQWSEANQHYLAGMLSLLRQQLEWYLSSLKDPSNKGDTPDFSTAIAAVEKTAAAMQPQPAIEQLAAVLKLSRFEKDILLMCAGMELDAGMGDLIAAVQGDTSFFQPTFGLAVAALQSPHWSAVSPDNPLRYWRLIELTWSPQLMRSPLRIDESVLHFLAGMKSRHEILTEIAYPVSVSEHLVPSQQKMVDGILEAVRQQEENTTAPAVFLNGPGLSGKTAIAASVAASLGLQLYTLTAFSIPNTNRDVAELARLWNREALLNSCMLYMDCSEMDRSDKQRLHLITSFIEQVQGPVILHADQWLPELKRNKMIVDLEKPDSDEQKQLWKTVLKDMPLPENSLNKIVSQFNISSDMIRRSGEEMMSHHLMKGNSNDAGKDVEKQLWKICCRHTRPQVDELAQRIEPAASWNDIVLPEAQIITLKEIVAQVKHRNTVYETWGFGSKGSRGLGISVLFAGESGTGKTMAAEVLANELKLDLYRIDLSKVVNKYIGETEKNLKRIFDAAEDGGAILLFDEADALFGKRSDVKDSHDRYSNIEVSYLLQRMEAYRGLAILTTNMKNALDKAFLRRIRFVIHFPFPDAGQRTEIWKKVFPSVTPKNGLDMERLGKFTIPGGNIRNIAMNAAFLAAGDDVPVQMSHVIRAARSEYDKIEKPFVNI